MKKKEEKKEKKHIFVKMFILIVIISTTLVLYSRYYGTTGLVVKEYKIESNNLPNSFSGLKIIHFSDLYYSNTTSEKDLDKITNTINELKPDIIVFTGNLYSKTNKMNNKDKDIIIKFLNGLNATTGKYIIKGASDYKIEYDSIINNIDFHLLNNSYDLIYYNGISPIFIGGVPSISKDILEIDKLFEYYKQENETLKKAEYKIIISSEGNVFDTILKYDNTVNLLLGSASLGGSVKVPFYGPLYIPKNTNIYYAPHYNVNNSEIFISSGIGTDNIKFRFNNKPSINLYRLKSI